MKLVFIMAPIALISSTIAGPVPKAVKDSENLWKLLESSKKAEMIEKQANKQADVSVLDREIFQGGTAPLAAKIQHKRRSSTSPAAEKVFQLNGAEKVFQLNGARLFTVADWKLPSWIDDNNNFAANRSTSANGITGIKVLQDGIYFIYSNFVFGGRGRQCYYYLVYGSQNQKCQWTGIETVQQVVGFSRRQPCSLGFTAKLKTGDVLTIKLYNGERCNMGVGTLESVLSMAKLGVIHIE